MVGLLLHPAIALTAMRDSDVRIADASQAAPATEATEAAPTQTEAAPTQTEAAPTQTEAAPTQTEAAPTQTEAAPTQQALLKQRVVAKWDALIRKDFATAYSFTSPAYRKLYSKDSFKGKFGSKAAWQRIEVVDVNFKGDDAATVGINLHFVYYDSQAKKPLDMKTYVQEPWVRVDGQWWYLMKE